MSYEEEEEYHKLQKIKKNINETDELLSNLQEAVNKMVSNKSLFNFFGFNLSYQFDFIILIILFVIVLNIVANFL